MPVKTSLKVFMAVMPLTMIMLMASLIMAKASPQNTTQTLLDSTDNRVHDFASVEVLPSFPGGIEKFYAFLDKNYHFSKEAREHGVSGRVTMSFIVEKDGSLSNIKVLRDLGMGTGEEAIRILEQSPKWKPGIQNGELVRVAFTMPIMLNLKATGKTIDNNVYQETMDMKPVFPGGTKKFNAFTRENYKYTDAMIRQNLQGLVLVSFIVEKDGSLSDIKVLRDLGYGTGAEAIRVLKLSPKWTPGMKNGSPVRCAFTMPVEINTTWAE
ncbi:energy transducer TonB [Pedobacter sp. BS3]|uniref:energy transducer TonB n=1 Tax=Pedobacter sp. BS3 TaxID=2567937 RepID=UPI001658E1E9|nr:energy transducer TonB [Pedobacter sp. BS3]